MSFTPLSIASRSYRPACQYAYARTTVRHARRCSRAFVTDFSFSNTGLLWSTRCAYPLWFKLRVSIHAWVLHLFQTDRNAHVAEAGVAPPRPRMFSAGFGFGLPLFLSASSPSCTRKVRKGQRSLANNTLMRLECNGTVHFNSSNIDSLQGPPCKNHTRHTRRRQMLRCQC